MRSCAGGIAWSNRSRSDRRGFSALKETVRRKPHCRQSYGLSVWRMARTFRFSLIITASALLAIDLVWLLNRANGWSSYGTITFVALDSASIVFPRDQKVSRWHEGSWRPALNSTKITGTDALGKESQLYLLTLQPNPTFGRFLEVIREFKKRGRCNIALWDSGNVHLDFAQSGGWPKAMTATAKTLSHADVEVPALVLCGNPIGDHGYFEPLPADQPIRL